VSQLSAATVTRSPGRSRSATAKTATGVSSTRTTIAVRPASSAGAPRRPRVDQRLNAAGLGGTSRRVEEGRGAHAVPASVNRCGDSAPRGRGETLGGRDANASLGGGGHDRSGDGVLARLPGGSSPSHCGLHRHGGARHHVDLSDSGGALERPGLVERPVLSKATRSTWANFSITTADFTSTPWRPALAIVASNGGMVASTTAHGEATIMKVIVPQQGQLA
jgi:hypothetical protein